jgi:hypothetical protein
VQIIGAENLAEKTACPAFRLLIKPAGFSIKISPVNLPRLILRFEFFDFTLNAPSQKPLEINYAITK